LAHHLVCSKCRAGNSETHETDLGQAGSRVGDFEHYPDYSKG
jgi:hypothetical protein